MPNTNHGFPPLPPDNIPSGFHVPRPQVSASTTTTTSTTSQNLPPPTAMLHTFPGSSMPMWQQQQHYQGYPMGNPNHFYNGYMPQASVPPATYYPHQSTQQPQFYSGSNHHYPPTMPHAQQLHQSQNYFQQTYQPPIASPPPPPPPPKEEFRCPPCNLILYSAQALQTHTSTHIKCDKCSFTAAPKVVNGHYSAVHGQYSGTGFKSVSITIPGSKKVQRFQICVGNHPDDIQRWIAERRKRFPRQSNQQHQQPVPVQLPNTASSNEGTPTHKESTLLGSLLAGYGSSSDDENGGNDDDNAKTINLATSSTIPKKVSELNTTTSVVPDGTNPQQSQQPFRTRLCRYFAKNGQCRNGDKCSFSHDRTTAVSNHELQSNPSQDEPPATKRQKMNPNTTKSNKSAGTLPPPPASLLQKLFANDIQREATLTLQLLEYIVRSNFLQPSDDSKNVDDP